MGDENAVVVINEALKQKKVLSLTVHDEITEVYPHLLIYVDGTLTLIGEHLPGRILINIPTGIIQKIKLVKRKYVANFMGMQLEGYVRELRSMNGKEDRLILKIRAGENFEILPPYQLLLNRYIVKTPNQDLIWAATLEMTPDLLDWFDQIKDKVEIIAPESFKRDFFEYLEKKIALIPMHKYYPKVS
ncbi:MAG: hypothetical protein A2381_07815 [Bdellovibrionales bacterium RIFOXYB1_FULL_37_110]|nr:MAG: hypothetical protein A2181_04580 [Bdellovibrionales bacterium RIFOXYA1_FULL_38_20]OFZ52510.1 MAG: hypothetical protein A2417_00535 [Bdellovibrionales bacterium RIFOXYC1_FULL_37_79]OFZ56224.1 MAG: hypothetical protein A2328_03075 [Bdellovibrionales bacterium RIFOXYB2_FULL_36_6]OFZ59712.1 MAG: hypothetical protein A2381_07815 [Bdellovibrionales bacterium RIFOXYB1_FULL_37_110]OFZ62639.1 MAG: hypothetical protein A2577_12135 [Bdellovibrionales bacterium RIFOXYD1_FULL_36_51]